MDVEMREARPDSKSSHVHRRMMVEGDRDEMTLARMGKKQVLKVRHNTPGSYGHKLMRIIAELWVFVHDKL